VTSSVFGRRRPGTWRWRTSHRATGTSPVREKCKLVVSRPRSAVPIRHRRRRQVVVVGHLARPLPARAAAPPRAARVRVSALRWLAPHVAGRAAAITRRVDTRKPARPARSAETQRPDRQQASGLQFTTDLGLRARTPCRLPSHQPRKGASRMLRSLMAKRCRYQARPRGTCLASARRSPANSRLKPNRGYSWMTLWRTASGISLLRRPNTSTAAPAERR
jgi:hypothetical protein